VIRPRLVAPTLRPMRTTAPYPGIVKAMNDAPLPPLPVPRLVVMFPDRLGRKSIDERLEALVAEVDWGDATDYGEDVVAPSVERRDEALQFLKRLARSAAERLDSQLPLPEVSPTMGGDIDMHWGAGQARELLLCVRADGIASFFGKAATGQTIKGTVRTDEENTFLAAWLA
jgi:hypothetical protein